jgi:hypothetical protein
LDEAGQEAGRRPVRAAAHEGLSSRQPGPAGVPIFKSLREHTLKTIPGMREFSKYATGCGGAQNHRMGLFGAI